MHMLWFVDGGILNGTPNNVSDSNKISFMNGVDSTFIVCGLAIVITSLANFGSYITLKMILLHKKW
jgi:hypothetical protein